jgi:hypothetical protein
VVDETEAALRLARTSSQVGLSFFSLFCFLTRELSVLLSSSMSTFVETEAASQCSFSSSVTMKLGYESRSLDKVEDKQSNAY